MPQSAGPQMMPKSVTHCQPALSLRQPRALAFPPQGFFHTSPCMGFPVGGLSLPMPYRLPLDALLTPLSHQVDFLHTHWGLYDCCHHHTLSLQLHTGSCSRPYAMQAHILCHGLAKDCQPHTLLSLPAVLVRHLGILEGGICFLSFYPH